MARTVTSTDRAIIRLLQRNARISYAELSRETGIPESTVRRRMDRLQQRGVIEFAMLAEPSKLGYDLRAMIGLKVELRRLKEIAETLRSMNEVAFASYVTGNFDIMIQVVVRSQEALLHFLTEQLAGIDGVHSTDTFLMPSIIKPMTSWVLPDMIEDDEVGQIDRDGSRESDADARAPGDKSATPRRRRGRPRKVATASSS